MGRNERAADAGGFINVDLEIGARTRAQLAPLIEQFKETLFEMHVGRIRGLYHAHYESHGPSSVRRNGRPAPTPSAVIHELADAIERLNSAGRRAWNAASMRDFNVGVDIARGVWMSEHHIEADAVRRIAALRARLVFTAYQEAALRGAPAKAPK